MNDWIDRKMILKKVTRLKERKKVNVRKRAIYSRPSKERVGAAETLGLAVRWGNKARGMTKKKAILTTSRTKESAGQAHPSFDLREKATKKKEAEIARVQEEKLIRAKKKGDINI